MSIEERIIVNFHPAETPLIGAPNGHRAELEPARFHGAAVVQLVRGDPQRADAVVVELHPADVTVTDERVAATDGEIAWSWLVGDLEAVIHGADDTWTIFVAPGISDFGVTVSSELVDEFRRANLNYRIVFLLKRAHCFIKPKKRKNNKTEITNRKRKDKKRKKERKKEKKEIEKRKRSRKEECDWA